ncbi:hypothetical protein MRX96_032916 [Rhipicephalus microplus]
MIRFFRMEVGEVGFFRRFGFRLLRGELCSGVWGCVACAYASTWDDSLCREAVATFFAVLSGLFQPHCLNADKGTLRLDERRFKAGGCCRRVRCFSRFSELHQFFAPAPVSTGLGC